MKLHTFTYNVFVADTFVGIVIVNALGEWYARNSILEYCIGKYCTYWEIDTLLKIFCVKIECENVEMNHDNIVSIDYDVNFIKKEY